MKFSIVLPPTVDAHHTVARAEELGFSRAWFFDSHMLYADVFVAMALAAQATSRIGLATGVAIPSSRIPPVTANAAASLNALAPGRITLGLGTGFTGRSTMGQGPVGLAEFEHQIEVLRGLLEGSAPIWRDRDGERRVQFMHDDARFGRLDPPVELHVSGMGPRSMDLTARLADGWLAFVPTAQHGVQFLESIAAACAAHDRDVATLHRSLMAIGCVLDDDETADDERGMAQAAPAAAVLFHNIIEGTIDFELPPALAEAAEGYRAIYEGYEPADARYIALHRGHLIRVRPEERQFISDELVRMTSFTGTAAELREQLGQLRDAGCDEFAIQLVPGHERELERWAELFELSPARATT